MQFNAVVPMLQTNDMARTRAWYENVLGFSCVSVKGNEWCRLARDGVAIMFMKNNRSGVPHDSTYFYVHDVMAVWNSIKGVCKAEWGPEKMPYGMFEFAIKDPNGYLLSFGQPTD